MYFCSQSVLEQKYVYIPKFCYIEVGFKGVYIAWPCFPDEINIDASSVTLKLCAKFQRFKF